MLALQTAPLLGGGLAQPVNPPCDSLARTFVFTIFQFTSATTAIGQGIVYDGDQAVGTFDARYSNIETEGNTAQGNGVIQMNGQHTLTFGDGSTLVTHDEILLQPENQNPGWMRANSRLYVVDGSGAYAGATGLFTLTERSTSSRIRLRGALILPGRSACLSRACPRRQFSEN